MRRLSLAFAGLLLLPVAAKADSFNLTATSSVLSGSAVLTGTSNNNGSFTITNITGAGITGLIAANDPDFLNDNLLFPTSTRLFDVAGLGVYGSFGRINLFSNVSGYELQGFDTLGNYFDVAATVTVSRAAAVTPEPSSILLSVTGLLAIAAAFLSKRFNPGFEL